MIKNWTTTITGEAGSKRLYVTSTDELIERDLKLPESGSLVCAGRHLNARQEVTNHSDHMDFACGAFSSCANGRSARFGKLELVDRIPDGLKETWVGGDGNGFLARLFEESSQAT